MRNNRKRVLIAPIGAGMAMSARKNLIGEDDLEVLAADSDPLSPGLHLTEKGFILPPISSAGFFPALERLAAAEEIDAFIPCLDPFLLPVAENRGRLEAIGMRVMVSPPETIRLSRDKWEMYRRLEGKVAQPVSMVDEDEVRRMPLPLFIKPRDGSGSVDAHRVDTPTDLEFYLERVPKPICQSYLPGREYTVDCVADMRGALLAASPRTRVKTKAGISVISQTVECRPLEEMAAAIASEILITGPFFFQAKEDADGMPHLTEINVRLAGTMALTAAAGLNIPLIALRLLLGEDPGPIHRPRKGVYLSRFYEETIFTAQDLASLGKA